jgi:hypothetical protein
MTVFGLLARQDLQAMCRRDEELLTMRAFASRGQTLGQAA